MTKIAIITGSTTSTSRSRNHPGQRFGPHRLAYSKLSTLLTSRCWTRPTRRLTRTTRMTLRHGPPRSADRWFRVRDRRVHTIVLRLALANALSYLNVEFTDCSRVDGWCRRPPSTQRALRAADGPRAQPGDVQPVHRLHLEFKPTEQKTSDLGLMLDQLVVLTRAMESRPRRAVRGRQVTTKARAPARPCTARPPVRNRFTGTRGPPL